MPLVVESGCRVCVCVCVCSSVFFGVGIGGFMCVCMCVTPRTASRIRDSGCRKRAG